MDGSVEWIDPEKHPGADPVAGPLEPSATEDEAQSAQSAEAARHSVALGTAAQPGGRQTVNLVAHLQRAQAEAEAAFRERELNEHWAGWCGVYPWHGERDPNTTDCPWWMAGAEYVFHLAAVWRKHSPGEPEKIETLLPKQIGLAADWVYRSRVYLRDIAYGKNSTVEHVFGGHAKRFSKVALSFAMRKFAESDLDEWRGRATLLAQGIAEIESGNADQSASKSALDISEPPAPGKNNAGANAPEGQRANARHKAKKPLRRNKRYERIDKALLEFAATQPKSHQEVFRLLDDRKVAIPNRMPFKAAGGWLKGFQQNRYLARVWLSQTWGRLNLPAFSPGPKKIVSETTFRND